MVIREGFSVRFDEEWRAVEKCDRTKKIRV